MAHSRRTIKWGFYIHSRQLKFNITRKKLKQSLWKGRNIAVIFSTVVGLVLLLRSLGQLQGLEWMALDLFFRWHPPEPLDSQIVLDHDGVVDKFIGDAVMAVFGIPIPRTTSEDISQDATAAVRCALEMGTQLATLNQHWHQKGLPTVAMRVGIATGLVVAGSLGGLRRQNYTTIGDTVNLAARLESYEKSMQDGICRILISEETYQYVYHQFSTQLIGKVKLKGKEKSLAVYQVFA